MWGAREITADAQALFRFIPTCVGSARALCQYWTGLSGSSPRVWGARQIYPHENAQFRFIPTCVGSAAASASVNTITSVHPHVCGERVRQARCIYKGSGSSPRVWGALVGHAHPVVVARFIPTCVGSAWPLPLKRICSPVHPHVCGERRTGRCSRTGSRGSSPRVWGALHPLLRWRLMFRFIPTCVGSARRGEKTTTDAAVHPHVCGEREYRSRTKSARTGSSPRVWGAQGLERWGNILGRFIPTCVGSA